MAPLWKCFVFSTYPFPASGAANTFINGIVGPLFWNYNEYGKQTKHLLKVGLSLVPWEESAMTTNTKPDRGTVEMNSEECKGCGLCVEACPPKVLSLAEELNHYGYHPAIYLGNGCTGCGICFFVCPEPGGIRVLRRELEPVAA
jgi:NAD-dependent dihydropyrimidine dehydrogenase PreA subunit